MGTLGTFSGAVTVVTVLAQFLKSPLDRLVKLPTRFVVLALAWALLLAHRGFVGTWTWPGLFLDFLNGFLVALTAIGTHSLAREHLNWK